MSPGLDIESEFLTLFASNGTFFTVSNADRKTLNKPRRFSCTSGLPALRIDRFRTSKYPLIEVCGLVSL